MACMYSQERYGFFGSSFDLVGMRVHTGLDVGDVIVVTVVGHALVVHRTVRVDVVHVLVHGAEHVAHVGFVAQ
jgi:hypothetical protein